MNYSRLASLGFLEILIALGAAVRCGGKTGNVNVIPSALTGAGGRVDSVDGSTSVVDAVSFSDAGACTLDSFYRAYCANHCCGWCGDDVVPVTLDTNSCFIQLDYSPQFAESTRVVVNCETDLPQSQFDIDAGGSSSSDSWVIDYSYAPARLLLGDSLCQSVHAMGDVSIFVLPGCPFICL